MEVGEGQVCTVGADSGGSPEGGSLAVGGIPEGADSYSPDVVGGNFALVVVEGACRDSMVHQNIRVLLVEMAHMEVGAVEVVE